MVDDPDVRTDGSGAAEGLRDCEGERAQDGGMSRGRVHRDAGPGAEPSGGELSVREASAWSESIILTDRIPEPGLESVARSFSRPVSKRYSFTITAPVCEPCSLALGYTAPHITAHEWPD